jgi:putative intracellular protease/amidase
MKSKVVIGIVLVGLLVGSAGLAVGPSEAPRKNVAILLFPGVQIIDYTGPWEVLGHASVNGQPAFRIYSVAESLAPITTSMGMSVNPAFTFANAPRPDVIVVPGGGVDPQLENAATLEWLRARTRNAEVVLSVCNGAFFLAKAGLLDGLEATTFAGLIDELRAAAPKTKVVTDKRFVDNGKIVTAAGLSSGIDGALHVIEKLYGRGTAQVAAVSLEYDWRPDSGYARASLADRHLSAAYGAIREYSRTVVRHEGTRERWETSWRIQTDAPPRAVLEKLDAALSAEKGWARQDRRDAAGSAESRWRLRDGDGSAWTEATRVEEVKGEKGYRVTVTVVRAATG